MHEIADDQTDQVRMNATVRFDIEIIKFLHFRRTARDSVYIHVSWPIDLCGNYSTPRLTLFSNLGPTWMEWISSLFLPGYGQRSRTSFFNTCIKKNFGFWPINVEISLNTKTRLRGQDGLWPLRAKQLLPLSPSHITSATANQMLLRANKKKNVIIHYQSF